MNLLIVESPNKAETIQKYLNSIENGWSVIATHGHFKNLKEKEMAIKKNDSGYIGNFVVEKKDIYTNLKSKIGIAKHVYIATDDDREGEAIAFDIVQDFKLDEEDYTRVIFTEISKKKVQEILIDKNIIEENSTVNSNLVNARFSRRLIDRFIGYKLSPLLKYIFKDDKETDIKGIGRVSYASLSLLTEREKEVNSFDSYTYKKLYATYRSDNKEFYCTSEKKYIEGVDDEDFYSDLSYLKNNPHIVTEYENEFVDMQPPKPILFSSLMSNVFYLYKYSTEQTAKIAQKLFEGVNIDGELTGLITYIRTDSYRISTEAASDAIALIPYIVVNEAEGPLGFDYVIQEQREYKNKKNAQDAHEALRPVHINNKYAPHNIRKYLSEEEFRVYDYIYKVTVSTFMTNSSYISTVINIRCGEIVLKNETKEQVFDGWEAIGQYYVPFFKKFEKFEKNPPSLQRNDELNPSEINYWSRKAKQPERYGEGRFIETLTNKGVGRPSTLPIIIPELIKKGYVVSNKGMLTPTKTALKLVAWADENASWITDLNHAREFEEHLINIENEEELKDTLIQEYDELLKDLYTKFNFKDMEEYKKEGISQEQRKTLDKIRENGVEVPESTYENKIKATKFIKKYFESQKICKCKVCEDGEIIKFPERFACNNKNCKFVLWRSRVEKFIKNFNIEMEEHELSIQLLKKKQVLVENMRGKNALFDANVYIENDDKYGYSLKFKVKRSKQ